MSFSAQALVTLIFVIVFIGIAIWAFWPANRQRFEHDGSIPLNDDDPQGQA